MEAPAGPGSAGGWTSLHATTVALNGRALVIAGPSGAGKSALALRMIALGAKLVADDLTLVRAEGEAVIAACPPGGEGRIEARGLGLLRLPAHPPCPVLALLDLSEKEGARLPPRRSVVLAGQPVALLHDFSSLIGETAADAALVTYLRVGLREGAEP